MPDSKPSITVLQKDQYGSLVMVPVCEKAKAFAAIAGTKTLTMQVISRIQALGYSVIVETKKVSFA